MNAKLLFKIRQTGRNYKNKQKITYLLIAANFFLLFSLYYCIFCCCLPIDPSVGRHLCFERDKKRYRGTKNDITGQKTISRDISFLCHRVMALIKAQVCDKSIYLPSIDIYVLIFTCRKWQCRIVSSLLEPEVPNIRVLKFCLPKKA